MYLIKKTPCSRFFNKWLSAAFVTVLFAVFALSVPAHAHKVTIFAWVEDDMVHTQSKFSGGRRVKNAPVEVYDAQGRKLLEGRTDKKGEFVFKSPGKGPLRIVLMAAMGHKAHWTLSAEELSGSVVRSEKTVPEAVAGKSDLPAVEASASSAMTARTTDIQAAVQTAVERALDKKLKPVIELLVDAQNPGPSFGDVLGGLGYILGLVGLGAYINYRKKGGSTSP